MPIRIARPNGHWCPNRAYQPLHQRPQPLVLAVVAAHRVGVDRQRQRRVGVPHLLHHDGRRLADRVQQRRERAPQPVRRQRRQRRSPASSSRSFARSTALASTRSGRCTGSAASRRGAEHERVRARVASPASQLGQHVAQHRPDLHLPPSRVRLRLADGQPAAGQVDVAPPQRQRTRRSASPAKTSVASCARRLTCWRSARDSRSSSPAASSSATIWPAESR